MGMKRIMKEKTSYLPMENIILGSIKIIYSLAKGVLAKMMGKD
jgi:hypothetical protein